MANERGESAVTGHRESSLGAQLRGLRLNAGVSQAELADRVSVHPGQIGRVERDELVPEAGWLDAFIRALALPEDDGAKLRSRLEEAARATSDRSSGLPSAAPRVWSVPGRNAQFTGRDEVLADLRRRVDGGLRAVILPVALRGLGGVGKTQLALEFAHRFKTDYDVVWWVDAEQLELIDVSFARLAHQMGLASTGNVPDDARQAREALRRGDPYSRWLVVFDNAAEPDDLLSYLPDTGVGGHLLVTSRDQTWAAVASTVEVDVFTRQESIARLTSVVGELAVEDADSIADLVGDLPLAVESAAAWLATTGTPVANYLEALAAESMRVLSFERPRGYALPVAAVWSLSLKRLREQEPAAAHLLELASFMSPDGIATELFYSQSAITALSRFDERVVDPLTIGILVRAVVRLSLMRADSNELRVHRLVQDAVRAQISDYDTDETIHAVHRILDDARPGPDRIDDPAEWPRYAQIWHHLAPSRADLCDEEEVRELMVDRVRFLRSIGEYQRAVRYARPIAARWAERLRSEQSAYASMQLELGRQLLVLQNEMAATLRGEGQLREAYEMDAETLARQLELLPERHPDVLASSGALAADLRGVGEYGNALTRSRRAYDDTLGVLGAQHPRTLAAANSLAVGYRLVGDFPEAQRIDEQTLARLRSVLGPKHPDTLHSQANYGLDLMAAGRYEESVENLAEARAGLVESLGQARPRTLSAATVLAWALGKSGRSAEALALAQETYAQYSAKYDAHHPDAMSCMVSLAAALSATGIDRHEEAAQMARAAVAGTEDRYGSSHPVTLAAVSNAGVYELRAGHQGNACALLERAGEGLADILGAGHVNACMAAVNLANCRVHAGRLGVAERLERSAVEGLTASLGANHPDTLAASHNLAQTLRALGHRREARALTVVTKRIRLDLEIAPIPL